MIQKDMGEILQMDMRGVFGPAMVTITKVYMTRDLSIARVYLSIFGVKDKKEVLEKVRQHARELRFYLGNRVKKQLRGVPELEFYEDDSLDYIENIDHLLNDK